MLKIGKNSQLNSNFSKYYEMKFDKNKLDSTDLRILKTLQIKGRISNVELADEINLSPSACHRRIQRIEEGGFIKDYVALLDPRKVGVPTTVFVEIRYEG